MLKKVLVGLGLGVAGMALTVNAMGGVEWLDSLGLLGQQRALASRVRGYWNARVGNDLQRMARYVHPLQEAIPDPGMLITDSYDLEKLEIEGDTALATLKVRSRLKHPILSAKQREVELRSRWVRYQGHWYQDVTPVGLADTIKYYRGEWTPPTAQAAQ
jgi:hypothetical protein